MKMFNADMEMALGYKEEDVLEQQDEYECYNNGCHQEKRRLNKRKSAWGLNGKGFSVAADTRLQTS